MNTDGWIKINRGIERHWLWEDGNRLKWWIFLLLHAQWEDGKVLCGNRLIDLKRGQLLQSVNNLASVWGCCRKTATLFLDTLQKEDMIIINAGYNGKSVITICNYESYQDYGEGVGYNAYYNEVDSTSCNTGSNTLKEKEKKQKNKEKIKEVKKKEKTLKKVFFQGEDFSSFKTIWDEYYHYQTGSGYFWCNRDYNSMESLLGKISVYVSNGEDIKDLLKRFLYKIKDKWTLNNLSVKNVDMKYNEIISQMTISSRKKNYVDFRPAKI